ncbi:hypothetical protein YQE_03149, partial [Dendroctonus ponderosae]
MLIGRSFLFQEGDSEGGPSKPCKSKNKVYLSYTKAIQDAEIAYRLKKVADLTDFFGTVSLNRNSGAHFGYRRAIYPAAAVCRFKPLFLEPSHKTETIVRTSHQLQPFADLNR